MRAAFEENSGPFCQKKTPKLEVPIIRSRLDENLRMYPMPSKGYLHSKAMEFEIEKSRKQTIEK